MEGGRRASGYKVDRYETQGDRHALSSEAANEEQEFVPAENRIAKVLRPYHLQR